MWTSDAVSLSSCTTLVWAFTTLSLQQNSSGTDDCFYGNHDREANYICASLKFRGGRLGKGNDMSARCSYRANCLNTDAHSSASRREAAILRVLNTTMMSLLCNLMYRAEVVGRGDLGCFGKSLSTKRQVSFYLTCLDCHERLFYVAAGCNGATGATASCGSMAS